MSSLATLELICFGPATARVNGGEPDSAVTWRKNLALLIHLALSGGSRSRDSLLLLLWPDKPQEKARHSLNEALRRLRLALGANRLISTADTVELSFEGLTVDATTFVELAKTDPVAAAALPRGEFLEGFTLSDAPGFDDWATQQRATLHQTWAETLLAQAEAALTAAHPVEAVKSANQALALMPYLQPALGIVIRARALAGDPAGARQAYTAFAEKLKNEIGQEPARELQELVARVEGGGWRRTFTKYPDLEPDLFGRASIHRAAFETVETALGGTAQSLSVTSEPGAGKTRLLKECCDRFALGGGRTAIARPLESDHGQPWSTLRMVVRSGLADAPGVTATDPDALSNIAALVPDLATRYTPVEAVDNGQVASALANMLTAIADEQPVVIAVDDAHLADATSLEVIHAAVAQLTATPVLLAFASAASDPNAPPEIAKMRSVIGRSLPGAAVRLKPLETDDLRDLARQLASWLRNDDEVDRMTRRLHFETKGNPFLAVTILRGLANSPTFKGDILDWPPKEATLDSPLPFTMPDLLRMSIAARTSVLNPETLDVLRVASVSTPCLEAELIAKVLDGDVNSTLERLDELERHQFIRFDGTRYSFVAPIVAQIVQAECLTRGKRQRLRTQVATALDDATDLESRALRAELKIGIDSTEANLEAAFAIVEEATANRGSRLAKRMLSAVERSAAEGAIAARIGELRKKLEA